MPLQSYKELIAWQKGIEFVAEIYRSTRVFPKEELYGLTTSFAGQPYRFRAISPKDRED